MRDAPHKREVRTCEVFERWHESFWMIGTSYPLR